jgi:hypothetical protein
VTSIRPPLAGQRDAANHYRRRRPRGPATACFQEPRSFVVEEHASTGLDENQRRTQALMRRQQAELSDWAGSFVRTKHNEVARETQLQEQDATPRAGKTGPRAKNTRTDREHKAKRMYKRIETALNRDKHIPAYKQCG